MCKTGYKAICFDKDGLLTQPYSACIRSEYYGILRYASSKVQVGILSNSIHDGSILNINDVNISCIKHRVKKPFCISDLKRFFGELELFEIAFVGDRLLTDVIFARYFGMLAVYVTSSLNSCDSMGSSIMKKAEGLILRHLSE